MSGSSDATLSVDIRLNNFVSTELGTVLSDAELKAGTLARKWDALGGSSGRASESMRQLGGVMSRSSRIANVTGLAVGGMGGAMGGLGPVTGAASAAIGLFGMGLGPVGIAIAGAVVLLGALSAAIGAADKKALDASEAGLKKMAERTSEISAASKQVVGAQTRARVAEAGDNPIARLRIQQEEELKGFKGSEGQKSRLTAAFQREADALRLKLSRDAYQKRLEVETKLEGELAELDIGSKKKGLDKEIALIRLQQRTKLEAAIAAGAEEGYAREVIAEQTGLKIQAITDKFEAEAKEKRKKSREEITEASFNLASNTLGIFSGVNEVESSRLKQRTKERIELVDEQERQGILTKRQAERAKEKIEKDSLKRQRALSREAQKYAYAEAVINVAQGITKAFAQGGVLGFITGAAVAAAGGVQIAKINAQEFEEGGFPSLGGPSGTLIRVNEGGRQEAVLNANATRRLGRTAINQLNQGGNVTTNSAPQFNYAPNVTVQVTGTDPREVVRALENQRKEFFTFIEESNRRGYRG